MHSILTMLTLRHLNIFLFCLITVAVVTGREGFGPGPQEYGYVEVRKGAHMFYWLYYKNTVKVEDAFKYPLVIYINGGPCTQGGSSGVGNFMEIGTLDIKMKERGVAWTKHVNVLYIDSPVGSGFSYVENGTSFARNTEETSMDLMAVILKFYSKYEKFNATPLYIFGVGYSSRTATLVAYNLYKKIQEKKLKMNLKGIALGNPIMNSPYSTVNLAPLLYQMGVIDTKDFLNTQKIGKLILKEMENGEWNLLNEHMNNLLNLIIVYYSHGINPSNVLNHKQSLNMNRNGSNETTFGNERLIEHFHQSVDPVYYSDVETFMNGKVKPALKGTVPKSVEWGAQRLPMICSIYDWFHPYTVVLEKVLNETNLNINIYAGQVDGLPNMLGTQKWVEELKWNGADAWYNTTRTVLSDGPIKQAYVKSYEKFTMYWILLAGELVPLDNPLAASLLLKQITQYDNTVQ